MEGRVETGRVEAEPSDGNPVVDSNDPLQSLLLDQAVAQATPASAEVAPVDHAAGLADGLTAEFVAEPVRGPVGGLAGWLAAELVAEPVRELVGELPAELDAELVAV